MRRGGMVGIGLGLLVATPLLAEVDQVNTPSGLARIEGDTRDPNVERLVVADRVAIEPEPDSAQQRVWIEAQVGTLLLVGLASLGNDCLNRVCPGPHHA